MKLAHIADLHIGKRVNGLSMIEEQGRFIDQLLDIVKEEQVQVVLIAGDVFDRPIPSREALETCERLFSRLCQEGVDVFAIPGNHDSPQQLSFCSALLASSGLRIAKAFDGSVPYFDVGDEGQSVRVHLLPFVRPTDVRMALPDMADSIESHDDAVRAALSQAHLAEEGVNILVAHQFVTSGGASPQTCDSEVVSVGGSDNVDASAFDAFDYVALGHLHGSQSVSRPQVRYSGSPLAYSFSEIAHDKGAMLLTIENDGISIDTRPFEPIHRMREITASYQELLDGIDTGDPTDYMRVELTDKSLPDAMAKLRLLYPNILRLDWQYLAVPLGTSSHAPAKTEGVGSFDLFLGYFKEQTGTDLDDDSRSVVEACIEEVGA